MASEIDVAQSASVAADAELFVAVDNGGTKNSACLVGFSDSSDRRVLGRGRSSAGNPFSVGFDESTWAIAKAIEQACSVIEGECRVVRLMLSIAGAANKQMSDQFVRWALNANQAKQVAIVS